MQAPLAHKVVAITRQLVHDRVFVAAHRMDKNSFTRQRLLTFPRLCVLIVRKTVRSAHAGLTDFFARVSEGLAERAPTASACTQARAKLKHTAFIELNRRAILDPLYAAHDSIVRWRDRRVLAIDSSILRLPATESMAERFGWTALQNQNGPAGRCVQARLCVLYDLLNQIALDALVTPLARGERQLAIEQLGRAHPSDVIVMDRGFASHQLFASCLEQQRDFVCRCERTSFAIVRELFARPEPGRSVTALLQPPARKKQPLGPSGRAIQVRFITVALCTGELEVLATSLLDEEKYPTAEFGKLYQARWAIETYYGRLKGRLDLEHFSGQTLEAVLQDIHAAIYLSNLETILIGPAQTQLQRRSQDCVHRQQVNHAVAFHALKSRLIELLLSQKPIDQIVAQLEESFLQNAQLVRPERHVPRRASKSTGSFHRNIRKSVF
jgi:hypothetical protein